MSTRAEKYEPGSTFYMQIPEPDDFSGLLDQLSWPIDLRGYVGDMTDRQNREKAANVLKNSDSGRIIGTMVGGRVAGFIFDPSDQKTISIVHKIKSMGGASRQDLFAVVCNLDTALDLINPEHIKGMSIGNLAGECFVKVPVKNNKVDLLAPNLRSQDKGRTFVQFFIPHPQSFLDEIVSEATADKVPPILAGTSMNFSKMESLMHRLHAARFCAANLVYWLDAEGEKDYKKRGSYTIIELYNGQFSEVRQGNMSFDSLVEQASGGKNVIQFRITT